MIYMLVIIIHGSQAISKFLPNPILQEKCRLKKMERAVKRENTRVKVRGREKISRLTSIETIITLFLHKSNRKTRKMSGN